MNDLLTSMQEAVEERAAILEYCANYSREEAERRARIEVDEWIKARKPDDEVQP